MTHSNLDLPRFGAHMSIAGGMHRAFERAAEAGCDCLQVFVKNQRQWNARPLTGDEIEAWQAAAERTGIGPVVAHATYLINLASPDRAARRKSLEAFVVELQRCEQLGIEGLVVHPGSHMDDNDETRSVSERDGCRRVAAALREAIDRLGPARVRPLLEVTAGQGTCLGHRFEHLAEIIEASGCGDRVGVCFDTCHALAAGYDLASDAGWQATRKSLERSIGLRRLACFHLNDSMRERDSRVDRHTHIGAGHVGTAGFRRIVNDPAFRRIPMILETPKGTDERGRDYDRLNLARLRRLVRQNRQIHAGKVGRRRG
jgi:deoxyribonuclease-4